MATSAFVEKVRESKSKIDYFLGGGGAKTRYFEWFFRELHIEITDM